MSREKDLFVKIARFNKIADMSRINSSIRKDALNFSNLSSVVSSIADATSTKMYVTLDMDMVKKHVSQILSENIDKASKIDKLQDLIIKYQNYQFRTDIDISEFDKQRANSILAYLTDITNDLKLKREILIEVPKDLERKLINDYKSENPEDPNPPVGYKIDPINNKYIPLFNIGNTQPSVLEVPASTAVSSKSKARTSYDTSLDYNWVKFLQTSLQKEGHSPGAIDGKFGPKTRAAMQAFQKANGHPVTDSPDNMTLEVLMSKYTDLADQMIPGHRKIERKYTKQPEYLSPEEKLHGKLKEEF